MERVIAYIDGYNLYYGLRTKGWKWFYWLDLTRLVANLLQPQQQLIETKYFTTIVNRPKGRHDRQTTYLEALKTLPGIQFYYGHFLSNPVECRNCGYTYELHHEKMTDVNIAVELLTDAFQDRFDLAFLITADSDLVSPIDAVKRLFPEKHVLVAFPPARVSAELKRHSHAYIHIGRDKLSRSLFPDEVIKPDGFTLHRPKEWR